MATTTLVPNGDILTTSWVSTGASFYTEIDETIASADGDTTKIRYNGQLPAVNSFSTIKFDLSATPADFATPSAVTVKINAKGVVTDNDVVNWGLVTSGSWLIKKAGGSGDLSTSAASSGSALTASYATYTVNHTGTPTGTKSEWDGAELWLLFSGTTNAMADATREAHVTAVEVICTYTPTSATLTAGSGSYSVTGTAATLKRGLKVTASAGSYSITGTAATLKKGYPITASAGSYSVTGTAATLRKTSLITSSAGAYSITGTAATLKRGYPLTASAGSYSVTGTAATLLTGHKVAASSGTYSITGQSANLLRGLKVTASAGSFSVNGQDATLTYSPITGYTIAADSGSFAVNGTAASLLRSSKINADAGSYAIAGTDSGLFYGRKIASINGVYTVTGTSATFLNNKLLTCLSGGFNVTGTTANLKRGYVLSPSLGLFNFSGQDVVLSYHQLQHYHMLADDRLIEIKGSPVEFRKTTINEWERRFIGRTNWREFYRHA